MATPGQGRIVLGLWGGRLTLVARRVTRQVEFLDVPRLCEELLDTVGRTRVTIEIVRLATWMVQGNGRI
jgi:hypothetical protein